MPLLLDPAPQAEENRPLSGPEESAPASGEEARAIYCRVIEMLQHWFDRSEHGVSNDDLVDTDYRHVPFQAAGSIRVRYKRPEPLLPRRFTTEDG